MIILILKLKKQDNVPSIWDKFHHFKHSPNLVIKKIVFFFFLIFFLWKTGFWHINQESFRLILQNLKLICVIGTVQTYLGFWGKRLNFSIIVAEIQPKVWERRRKRWREKMLNFGNGDTEFPVPNSAARVCVECLKWKEKKILTN